MILKKLGDEYKLYSHDSCIATTYESPYQKLSLKNCQAIANGYDVIDLAERNSKYNEEDWGSGFLFAMNLMSDKKFSEDDVRKAIEFGMKSYHSWKNRNEDEFIQSLQQNEWEVSLNPDEKDSEGCLILKRK